MPRPKATAAAEAAGELPDAAVPIPGAPDAALSAGERQDAGARADDRGSPLGGGSPSSPPVAVAAAAPLAAEPHALCAALAACTKATPWAEAEEEGSREDVDPPSSSGEPGVGGAGAAAAAAGAEVKTADPPATLAWGPCGVTTCQQPPPLHAATAGLDVATVARLGMVAVVAGIADIDGVALIGSKGTPPSPMERWRLLALNDALMPPAPALLLPAPHPDAGCAHATCKVGPLLPARPLDGAPLLSVRTAAPRPVPLLFVREAGAVVTMALLLSLLAARAATTQLEAPTGLTAARTAADGMATVRLDAKAPTPAKRGAPAK
mmetsp:Transcript_93297/g.241489  ORF Transcript_93297/g.241489 Transcript_93297/m.241489 type:complete len:322 (-) Transcript_93297:156-1121(-)